MTALLEVGARKPDHSIAIADLGARLGMDARALWTFRKFYGLDSVRRAPGEDLHTTLSAAVRTLTALKGNEHRVKYAIAARTVSTVEKRTERTLQRICDDFGLTEAVAFTVTQHACASGLLAVEVAGGLLAADPDPDALALVLVGEKVFTDALEMIPESTVMGESTAACLVSASGERDELLGYATRTRGQYSDAFPPDPLDPGFLNEHNDLLAEVITEAADAAGVAVADLALLLPHNVNRLSWSWACKVLGIPLSRVYLDNIPVTGHCFTADPFINYVDALAAGRLTPGDLYLMASVGLGATFSAAVLRH